MLADGNTFSSNLSNFLHVVGGVDGDDNDGAANEVGDDNDVGGDDDAFKADVSSCSS